MIFSSACRSTVPAHLLCVFMVYVVGLVGCGGDSAFGKLLAKGSNGGLKALPVDGQTGVDPGAAITIELRSKRPRYAPTLFLRAEGADRPHQHPCEIVDDNIRCSPNTALAFDTTYKAEIIVAFNAEDHGSTTDVPLKWSFSTLSRYDEDPFGLHPDLIRVLIPEARGLSIQGLAGAFPPRAIEEGWMVSVRLFLNGALSAGDVAIQDDGSFTTRVGERHSKSAFFESTPHLQLEVADRQGELLFRRRLGPLQSEDGGSFVLHRGEPFRVLGPDGSVVLFDGTTGTWPSAKITLKQWDRGPFREDRPEQLDHVGRWHIGIVTLAYPRDRFDRHRIRGNPPFRPGLGVWIPANGPVADDALVLDAELLGMGFAGTTEWIKVRGLGEVVRWRDAAYLSLSRSFAVRGASDRLAKASVDSSRVLGSDLRGWHTILVEKDREIAVVLVDGCRSWSRHDVVMDHLSPLRTVAAAGNGDLVLLPVLADRPITLSVRDVNSSWSPEVSVDAVSRHPGVARYAGNLEAMMEKAKEELREKRRQEQLEREIEEERREAERLRQ